MPSDFKHRRKNVHLLDEFVDKDSRTHQFVLCGVLTEAFNGNSVHSKQLSIGVAIIKSGSDFDLDRGKDLALSRAMRCNSRLGTLTTKDINMLSRSMIKQILKNEAEYIKADPEKYIKMIGRKKALNKKNANEEVLLET